MGLFDFLYENQKKLAKAKYEFPNRKRILQESIHLMQTTHNLDTLLTRYDESSVQYSWIRRQIANGVPITFKSNGDFSVELKEHANYHIERIARESFDAFASKMATLKTDKAKENQKIKFIALLDRCKDSLKLTDNTQEWMEKIEQIKLKLL